MENLPSPALAPRSRFVTIVAIVFLVLSAGSTLVGVLQNLMINFLFPAPELGELVADHPGGMPPFAIFLFSHMRLMFLLVLLMSATTLVASIGLLKRLAWGRLLFIGVMGLGIVWNICGVLLQHWAASTIGGSLPPTAEGAPDIAAMLAVMRIAGLVMALLFSSLFGWIIYKLVQPEIAAEFETARP
jgi:hypothetical protein